MSDEIRVGIVLVSHSAALAEGAAEVAGQISGGSVIIAAAGGTDDGGIGTSIARVRRAVQAAGTSAGVVILPDLGSSVLTVRALLAEEDFAGPVALADAPFVEERLRPPSPPRPAGTSRRYCRRRRRRVMPG